MEKISPDSAGLYQVYYEHQGYQILVHALALEVLDAAPLTKKGKEGEMAFVDCPGGLGLKKLFPAGKIFYDWTLNGTKIYEYKHRSTVSFIMSDKYVGTWECRPNIFGTQARTFPRATYLDIEYRRHQDPDLFPKFTPSEDEFWAR